LNLPDEPLGSQNLHAALQALIVGQYVPLHPACDRANQYVYRSTLNAAAAAEIEQARCFFVVERCEWFVWKSSQRGAQFLKLSQVLNAGENFLPDRANDGYAAILNGFLERCKGELLIAGHRGPVLAPQ
jgi:hypothetical protein